MPVLFIPHGGGPLPLLGDADHRELVAFLREITTSLAEPAAILVISAHWEADRATVTSGKTPSLIYDYSGFPDQAYSIEYPAPGDPELADTVFRLLQENGIEARTDDQRGFDHGLFVPLKLMYPDATIPCIQLSLVSHLDPEAHIRIGQALAVLGKENVLIVGSGFSFHNLRAFRPGAASAPDTGNETFEQWLIETCTSHAFKERQREERLTDWESAPAARYCHPREEHLLPLHVCYGIAGSPARLVFDGKVLGKKTSAFLW